MFAINVLNKPFSLGMYIYFYTHCQFKKNIFVTIIEIYIFVQSFKFKLFLKVGGFLNFVTNLRQTEIFAVNKKPIHTWK